MKAVRILTIIMAALLVARVAGFNVPVSASAALLALVMLHSGSRAMRDPSSNRLRWLREQRFELAVVALALLAILLQVNGLWADIGHTPLDIDENRLAHTVRVFFQSGDIPHYTVEDYPGIFYWLVVGAYLPAYLWALTSGVAASFGELSQDFLVAVGRGLNVPIYAGTVILTAVVGRQLSRGKSGMAVGVIAAGLMAMSSMGLRITAQFRNEAGVLLLVVAALAASMMLLSKGRTRLALLAGALAGLACGVKYTGVFALLPVLGAAVWRREGESAGKLAAASGAGFLIALGASNPFLWLDFPNFIEQLSTEIAMTGAGHWAASDNPAWYYTDTLTSSFGVPAMLVAGAVAIIALTRPIGEIRLLLAFALPYQLFMTRQAAQFERWVYLLLPVVACLTAWGVVRGYQSVITTLASRTSRPVASPIFAAGLALAVLTPSLLNVGALASRRAAPSTFQQTLDWMSDNIAEDETVLTGVDWLNTSDAPYRVTRVPQLGLAISGSPFMLGAYDWLVVPEPETETARSALADAVAEAQIVIRRGFGGNLGFDFFIYRTLVPRLRQRPWGIDPATTAGSRYLGSGWELRNDSARIVGGIGQLFLPLRPNRGYLLTVVGGPAVEGGPSGLRVGAEINDVLVTPQCVFVPESGPEIWRCEVLLPPELIGERVDRVALSLGSTDPVTIHRIDIAPDTSRR